MSFGFSAPQRCDFDTQEDYEYALQCYRYAEDDYADEYIERKRGIDI